MTTPDSAHLQYKLSVSLSCLDWLYDPDDVIDRHRLAIASLKARFTRSAGPLTPE